PLEASRLDTQSVVQRQTVSAAGRLNIGTQRWLRKRGDRLAELYRALQACTPGNNFVDQPDCFSFARVDDPSGDDEFDGTPVAEDAGEALSAAICQADVPAPAGD